MAPPPIDNPFATKYTRPGAIPFLFHERASAQSLLDTFFQRGQQGAIVGPHGCGKTTLLLTLARQLSAMGTSVQYVRLHASAPALPDVAWHSRPPGTSVLILDGYEQLGWLTRWRLRRHCRRQALGLLVSSHRRTRLPTLLELLPNLAVALRVVEQLLASRAVSVPAATARASYARHNGNIRDMLFDLYDRHERLQRQKRTKGTSTSYA